MAAGRPRKWVTARISEPIEIKKNGVELIIWDKRGKACRGTVIVSVGGMRWYPYRAKKPYRVTWDELTEYAEGY